MNWVGGARNRLRLQNEKKLQRVLNRKCQPHVIDTSFRINDTSFRIKVEFFERKKFTMKHMRIKPGSGVSRVKSEISQDLLAIATLSKAHSSSKSNQNTSIGSAVNVQKIDLDKYRSSCRGGAVKAVELPVSPGCEMPSLIHFMDSTSEQRERLHRTTYYTPGPAKNVKVPEMISSSSRAYSCSPTPNERILSSHMSGCPPPSQSCFSEVVPHSHPSFIDAYVSKSHSMRRLNEEMINSKPSELTSELTMPTSNRWPKKSSSTRAREFYNIWANEDFQMTPLKNPDAASSVRSTNATTYNPFALREFERTPILAIHTSNNGGDPYKTGRTNVNMNDPQLTIKSVDDNAVKTPVKRSLGRAEADHIWSSLVSNRHNISTGSSWGHTISRPDFQWPGNINNNSDCNKIYVDQNIRSHEGEGGGGVLLNDKICIKNNDISNYNTTEARDGAQESIDHQHITTNKQTPIQKIDIEETSCKGRGSSMQAVNVCASATAVNVNQSQNRNIICNQTRYVQMALDSIVYTSDKKSSNVTLKRTFEHPLPKRRGSDHGVDDGVTKDKTKSFSCANMPFLQTLDNFKQSLVRPDIEHATTDVARKEAAFHGTQNISINNDIEKTMTDKQCIPDDSLYLMDYHSFSPKLDTRVSDEMDTSEESHKTSVVMRTNNQPSKGSSTSINDQYMREVLDETGLNAIRGMKVIQLNKKPGSTGLTGNTANLNELDSDQLSVPSQKTNMTDDSILCTCQDTLISQTEDDVNNPDEVAESADAINSSPHIYDGRLATDLSVDTLYQSKNTITVTNLQQTAQHCSEDTLVDITNNQNVIDMAQKLHTDSENYVQQRNISSNNNLVQLLHTIDPSACPSEAALHMVESECRSLVITNHIQYSTAALSPTPTNQINSNAAVPYLRATNQIDSSADASHLARAGQTALYTTVSQPTATNQTLSGVKQSHLASSNQMAIFPVESYANTVYDKCLADKVSPLAVQTIQNLPLVQTVIDPCLNNPDDIKQQSSVIQQALCTNDKHYADAATSPIIWKLAIMNSSEKSTQFPDLDFGDVGSQYLQSEKYKRESVVITRDDELVENTNEDKDSQSSSSTYRLRSRNKCAVL